MFDYCEKLNVTTDQYSLCAIKTYDIPMEVITEGMRFSYVIMRKTFNYILYRKLRFVTNTLSSKKSFF